MIICIYVFKKEQTKNMHQQNRVTLNTRFLFSNYKGDYTLKVEYSKHILQILFIHENAPHQIFSTKV